MNQTAVLQIRDLAKQFGPIRAVDGVSLSVARGQIFGFLGPNGAGKTTTIGMVLGLIHPTSGTVELFGQRVTPGDNRALRRVGALVGSPALVPHLSARDNLALQARLHPGLPTGRIEAVLGEVGLSEAARRKANSFSSGMKQRLGLALALLHEPELLILDEPTNAMDPAGMREVRHLLRSLAERGVTIFLSSHLLHEVEQLCDEVAVLHRGKLVAAGRTSELKGQGELVRLRIAKPDEASALLGRVAGATVVNRDGAWLTVQGLPSEQIVEQLAAERLFPSELHVGGTDLESLFLTLTQEGAPPPAA